MCILISFLFHLTFDFDTLREFKPGVHKRGCGSERKDGNIAASCLSLVSQYIVTLLWAFWAPLTLQVGTILVPKKLQVGEFHGQISLLPD